MSQVTINSLHEEEPHLPPGLVEETGWAACRIALLPTVNDGSLSRRATMLLLACLRSSGVLRVFTEITKKEIYAPELYTKIGRFIDRTYPTFCLMSYQVTKVQSSRMILPMLCISPDRM